MAKRPERQTFADIVRDVESSPSEDAEPRTPGFYDDDVFVDAEGRRYELVDESVGASRAYDAAKGGARVVWDPCGCGGACGMEWFSDDQVARMVATGPPEIRKTKRKRGSISEWRDDQGQSLLIAEDAVRWGDLLE